MQQPVEGLHWLSDEDYQKAVTQLKIAMGGIFDPFQLYGLNAFIPGAVAEAVNLAEDFGLRVRGVDKIINLDVMRRGHGLCSFDPRDDGRW